MDVQADCVFMASYDDATLIASGSVIPLADKAINITVPMGNNPLTVRITFEKDEKDTSSRTHVTGNKETPRIIHINFINIKSPFGGGPKKPIILSKSPSEEILLMIRIYSQNEYPPLIHFSFYLKNLKDKKEEEKI
jgi:hypothetical protein